MVRNAAAGDASKQAWFKSSHSSNGNEGDCVEVAAAPASVLVRDSKNAQGPRLAFGQHAWAGFLPYVSGR